jgi:thioredoxin reductase (NADPH)
MTQDSHDLVIAGSGVAGLSAAVYAARADLDPSSSRVTSLAASSR